MNLHYLKNRRSVLDWKGTNPKWDVFISAYNDSERVQQAASQIQAANKFWVFLPEYNYSAEIHQSVSNPICFNSGSSEADVVLGIAGQIGIDVLKTNRFCIDITGFMRPQIMYLVRYFYDQQITNFDMIYSEPAQYARQEHTTFSNEEIEAVRQVLGFEGIHNDEMSDDVLIIGIGYDDALISRVSNDKDGAKLIQLLSLPSLSADMYQESILRLDKTGSACNSDLDNRIFFAPANDPFVIASELSDKWKEIHNTKPDANIYLSPLATKPQALGFALFYLYELVGMPASILFPFARFYDKETSKGIGRTWLYEVAF